MTIQARIPMENFYKRKGWQTIHSMIIVAVIIHVSVILLCGWSLISSAKQSDYSFSVNLVKGLGGSEPTGKDSAGGGRQTISAPVSKPSEISKPNTVKTTPVQKQTHVKTHDTIKPKQQQIDNATAEIATKSTEDTQHDFPRIGGNQSSHSNSNSGGVPSAGKGNGELPGRGEGGSGGGEGSGGSPGGFQGIFLGYNYNLLPPNANESSLATERKKYFTLQETPPQLVSASFPTRDQLEGIGKGVVTVTITIPGTEELPNEGIKPSYIRIDSIKADYMHKANDFKQIARTLLENSLWYPGRRHNQIQEENITFPIYIYGTE